MTMFSMIPGNGTAQTAANARLRRFCRRIMAFIALVILAVSSAPVLAQTSGYPIIIADFNHDGIPDALLPSTTAPTATIAFGTVPYGTFSSSAKGLALPAACSGAAAGALLVGDFNADGFPDIAHFCGGGANASGVLLGNGDGTFAAAKTFTGVFSPSAVLGDFNHDGKLDMVILGSTTATGQQGILFLPGNGDGTFGTPTFTQFASGASYSSPIAIDVDQDGYPDIVVGSFAADSAPTVNVFGNNKDGTFGVVAQGSSTPSASVAVGTASSNDQAILTGNFYGTGKRDLAVPDRGSTPGIWVVKNTSTTGAFSLAVAVETAYPALQGAMVGTLTGSGFSDFVAANGAALTVLANDGTGKFTADYTTLTVPFASAQFAVADANADGYTDIYTATAPNGALQINVNLVSGSASAESQPFSLSVGSHPVSAAWSGNVNFTGSTATGTQTVTGTASVTMLTSSKNPSVAGAPVTFTALVSSSVEGTPTPTGTVAFKDGTTVLGSGNLDPTGTTSFTTSALTQGTHQIEAVYAGDSFFAGSVSAALSEVVISVAVTPTLTWPDPAPIAYGTPLSATQLDATASNASGNTVPGTYAYTPAAGTILNPGMQALKVIFTPADTNAYTTATKSVSLTVNPAPPSVTLTGPMSIPPGSQPTITFTIVKPYPVELTAVFTLTFASSTTPPADDPAIQFSAGGRTLILTIPANSTTVPPIQLQSGTVAGAITVTLQLTAGGVAVNPAGLQPVVIQVPDVVPVVKTISMTQNAGQLTVAIQGFSNTRELTQASFVFTAAPGNPQISNPDVTVDVGKSFANWFSSGDSIQYGSTFTYTQIFSISGGAASIESVQVTLTNSVGPSTPQTAQ
jgi:Bacterial Ig-like domain (group 3)/FG-GAP-like repeat